MVKHEDKIIKKQKRRNQCKVESCHGRAKKFFHLNALFPHFLPNSGKIIACTKHMKHTSHRHVTSHVCEKCAGRMEHKIPAPDLVEINFCVLR